MNIKVLRMFKKAAILVLPIILVISLASCDQKAKEKSLTPTDKFFVNDFASVMTEADIETVYQQGVALEQQTTAQAVVVTVESLEGKVAADYALEIGRQWGIGDKEKDNGIVILLSKNDGEIYIAVGYGLEGALPDSKTGRIIDTYGMPYFYADDFSTGLTQIYNSIVNEVYLEYGIQTDEGYTPIAVLPEFHQETQVSAGKVLVSWIVLVAVVVIYILIFGRRGGMFIFGSPRFFTGGFNFHGGGFGNSGGFGGFRGGGGSFGGGGAGRKF